VNARDENGVTPLMLAAQFNSNSEVITAFLKAGAEVNARDENGVTPLMLAAQFNSNPEVITAFLKAGANAKTKSKKGKTALDYAKENEKIYKTKAYWELNDAFHNQD
jgi:ankyrin repeat protein